MALNQQFGRTLSLLTMFLVAVLFSASLVGAFALFGDKQSRLDSQGAVKVSATLLAPGEGQTDQGKTIFELALDTHSVDLGQYDIEAISVLQFDDNPPIGGGTWESAGSGHHFKGRLSFAQPVPSGTKAVRLLILNLDGVKERVFEWQMVQ